MHKRGHTIWWVIPVHGVYWAVEVTWFVLLKLPLSPDSVAYIISVTFTGANHFIHPVASVPWLQACAPPHFLFYYICCSCSHVSSCSWLLEELTVWSICHLPPPPSICYACPFCLVLRGGWVFKLYVPVHYFLFDACEEENGYCVSVIVYLWVQFCLTVVCEVVFLAHIKMMQVCFSVNCTFETLHGHLFLALYNNVTLFFVSQLCWEISWQCIVYQVKLLKTLSMYTI